VASHALQKFIAYLVILCFERQCPKQTTVARLKVNIYAQKIFGLATLLGLIADNEHRKSTPHSSLFRGFVLFAFVLIVAFIVK